jgi:hypothetical protein
MKLALLRLYAALGGSGHRRRLSKALRKAGETQHWYYIIDDCCPQCGRDHIFRERVYGPRPASYNSRHNFTESWDGCD